MARCQPGPPPQRHRRPSASIWIERDSGGTRWKVTVIVDLGYWGRCYLPLYLRGDGRDIGDHHKKDDKGELLEH